MNILGPVKQRSFLERLLMRLCKQGLMPSHIGFILDGNLSDVNGNQLDGIMAQMRGMEKLKDVWSLLREMCITQATMYVFSVDNCKPSREEFLMLKKFFKLLLKKLPQFIEANICVRFIGQIDFLANVATDIQETIAQIVLGTMECTGFTLTIALGYSAREEMVTAIRDLQEAVSEGILRPEDITESTLSRALYTMGSTEPEMLIRTSGVNRLSDFLLWQSNFSLVHFASQCWPDYSTLNFLTQILNFQVQSRLLAQGKQQMDADLAKVDLQYCREVWSLLKDGSSLSEFTEKRNQRIDQAIEWIREKRLDVLRSFLNGSELIQCDEYPEKLDYDFTTLYPESFLLFSQHFKMSRHEKALSPELEAKLLEPSTYLLPHCKPHTVSKMLQAFNHWLNISQDKIKAIGIVAEMVSNSGLLLDDVQDNCRLRRGVPVAHSIYGVPLTVNAAYRECFLALEKLLDGFPEESRLEGVRIFTEQMLQMHQGQGLEMYWRDGFICPTEEQYLDMIGRKACSGMGSILRLMQLFSEDKRDFGYLLKLLGTYIQIANDYSNLKSKKSEEGKSFADDLTEGKFSFPIIHAIHKSPDDKSFINILKQRTENVQMKKYAVSLMEESGSLAYTQKVMNEFLEKLEEEIEKLGGNPLITGLIEYLKEK